MPFGVLSGIPNIIIHAKFHVDRLRGFWAAGPPKVPFPIFIGTTLTTVLHYRADCDNNNNIQIFVRFEASGPFHCGMLVSPRKVCHCRLRPDYLCWLIFCFLQILLQLYDSGTHYHPVIFVIVLDAAENIPFIGPIDLHNCSLTLIFTVLYYFMPLPPDIVGKAILFSVCPSRLFVCSSGEILLPRYLVNGLNIRRIEYINSGVLTGLFWQTILVP